MLSKNELKFLRHIFEHLLNDVEDYANRAHLYLFNLNNLFQEIKYKLSRSYYYLSIIIYLLSC
ncbi:unnamed protein product [marine sediment metagenome]|uniref:Uncharacterized protein n=1 Tax=marine sediment metagenome TaxID=412755 RepID=X0Z1C7_9ZZZZ